ncbi:MAG: ATPase domain-containing protein [Candidatus Anstonellaceae archaeon]
MEASKVKSGIPGLDKMLGGGFPKNSVIAVSGGTGSGRTTFVFQFLVAGALEYDEPGLFLSFDEQKGSIYSHLASFGWDLMELEKKQQIIFIEYPQNELSSFVEQEGALRDLIETLGIKRVAVDSITPYALLYTNPEERRTNTLKLVSAIRGWKTVSLISAEDIPGSAAVFPHTISGVESFADGFIHISFLREGRVRHRTVEIIKMRGCKHEHEARLAWITEKGFVIADEEKRRRA